MVEQGTSVPAGANAVTPDPELWARICAYEFDVAGASMPFSLRLAQDNGWPHGFAVRVLDEYRRFVYLACIAGRELTPSDEVDQAWHQHLAYSRMYWEDFCPNVLRRPLHHGPTAGGEREDTRYKGNYRDTLAVYREVVGGKPPPDIWPPSGVRFLTSFTRVNRMLFWPAPNTTIPVFGTDRYPPSPGVLATAFVCILVGLLASGESGILASLFFAGVGTFLFHHASRAVNFVVEWMTLANAKQVFTQTQHGFEVSFAAIKGGTVPHSMRRLRPARRRRGGRAGGGDSAHGYQPWYNGCGSGRGTSGCAFDGAGGCGPGGGGGCGGGGGGGGD